MDQIWEEQLCDICKKKPVKIRLEGVGCFCLDCFNQRMLDEQGVNNKFDYSRAISVIEKDGTVHAFRIEHMIIGTRVFWDAYENNGDYHFRYVSDVKFNAASVARVFYRKIANDVCTKTISKLDIADFDSREEEYSLKIKGNIRIAESENNEGVSFVIDGKRYSAEEFCKLFKGYEDFNLQYQIRDMSDPLLGEDEYLMPVRISRKILLEELEGIIGRFEDGTDFISYKRTMNFSAEYWKLLEKLELFMNVSGKREEATECGRDIVHRLQTLETDDDFFPEYEISETCKIVDPFREDEELSKLIL